MKIKIFIDIKKACCYNNIYDFAGIFQEVSRNMSQKLMQKHINSRKNRGIAQLVEQRSPKPCVGHGSVSAIEIKISPEASKYAGSGYFYYFFIFIYFSHENDCFGKLVV